MPRKPIDYSKTYFYKIVCKDTSITDCYVGHTTDFTKRKSQHKSNSNNQKHKEYYYFVYQFIRNNGNWDNFEMVLINVECCENGFVARQRERFYKEQLKATLNIHRPFVNAEEAIETKMQLNELYKENGYWQNYRDKHKEHIKQVKHQNYINKKPEIQAKNQEWYKQNKDSVARRQNEKFICGCGGHFTKVHKQRHERTNKHQKYLQSLKQD